MQGALQFPRLKKQDAKEGEPKKKKVINLSEIKKAVGKDHLTNKLNHINFQEGIVFVNFKHPKYDHTVSVPAKPLPCSGESLDCVWAEPNGIPHKLKTYKFQNLHVPDGQKLLLVKPDAAKVTYKGIRLRLPEFCWEVRAREKLRHLCYGIQVQLIQNGVVFSGSLIDFSGNSVRVEVNAKPPQTFQWMDPESTVSITATRPSPV